MTTPTTSAQPATQSRRLNVELLDDSAQALDDILRWTGLNKVSAANRAFPLLREIIAAQRAGDRVIVQHQDATETRLVFL